MEIPRPDSHRPTFTSRWRALRSRSHFLRSSQPATTGHAEADPWKLAVLVGLVSALVYVVLPRSTWHGYDPYWLLPKMLQGKLDYPLHPLSLHVMKCLDGMLCAWGGDLHERLRIASGLCSGLAVALFTHSAWLLLRSRRSALSVGVLYACLPASVNFATVMELHAIFLPAAACTVWFACWLLTYPTRIGGLSGLALGALTSFATSLHSTGNLLVPFLAAWLLFELRRRGMSLRGWLRFVFVLVCAHVLGCLFVQWSTGGEGAPTPAAAQLGFLVRSQTGFGDLHRLLFGEWIHPYAPAAVFCWFCGREWGALRVCLLAALVVQLSICATLLVMPMGGYVLHEFGAYQQTLGFFATVLTFEALGRRFLAILAIALFATSSLWWSPAKEPPDRSFGEAAIRYMTSSDDRLLVGCFAEFDGIFHLAWADAQRSQLLARVVGVEQLRIEVMQGPPCTASQLAALLHPAIAHAHTVITIDARDQLLAAGGIFREFVEDALPAAFQLREVRSGDSQGGMLRGFRLEPR